MSSQKRVNKNFAHIFMRNQIGQRSNQPSVAFPNKSFSNPEKLQQLRVEHTLPVKHEINCMNLHPNNDIIAVGTNDHIQIWDWKKQKNLISYMSGTPELFSQIKFLHLQGCWHVVTGSRNGYVKLFVLDTEGLKYSKKLYQHHGRINRLISSPDKPPVFYTASDDGVITLHDLRTPVSYEILNMNTKIAYPSILAMDIHPSGQEFLVGGNFGCLKIYELRMLNKDRLETNLPRVTMETDHSFISALNYNHNGNQFLAAFGCGISLYDNSTSEPSKVGYYSGIRNTRFSKDSKFFGINSEFIISASDCGSVFIWDKKGKSPLLFLEGMAAEKAQNVELHSELPYVFTGGIDRTLKVWTPTSRDKFSDYTNLDERIHWNNFMNNMQTVNPYQAHMLSNASRSYYRNAYYQDAYHLMQ